MGHICPHLVLEVLSRWCASLGGDKFENTCVVCGNDRFSRVGVMQPSTRNSIKRAEIENKRVIHTLTINNRDKYQSSSREEPPYTMYYVPKTR